MLREKIVIGEHTKYPLNGLLTLPDDLSAPVPAVVFVHGSGSSDMDEKSYQDLLRDKPNVTFKLYAGLNHAFVPAIYDSIMKAKQEFGKERHIGEKVISDIADWIEGSVNG